MIVVDTTVLVGAVARGAVRATTTVDVVQEFVHVRARRRPRDDAVELGRRFATLLAPLLVVGPDDLERGLALFAGSSRLGALDGVLAATAVGREAEALVSADGAFAEVDRLPVLRLEGRELAERLG